MQSLATNFKYSKMVAKQMLLFAAAQNKDEWKRLCNLLLECINKSVFSADTLINVCVFLNPIVLPLNNINNNVKFLTWNHLPWWINKKFFYAFVFLFFMNKNLFKMLFYFEISHTYITAVIFFCNFLVYFIGLYSTIGWFEVNWEWTR